MKLEKYETPNMEVMSFDGENILCASVLDDFNIEGDTHLSTQDAAIADAQELFQ